MEDGRQLIIEAFKQARDSGKSDWYRMTTAVLKNRLLDLTDRGFNESDYGAWSFTDFVSRRSDILNFYRDQLPVVVELKPEQRRGPDSDSAPGLPTRMRIRGDLWRAVFDRSSGSKYYWLAEIGEVGTSPTEGSSPILPIIDAETDRQMRRSFVTSLSSPPPEATEWAEFLLPLVKLPAELRYQWNQTLTEHVHQRLTGWFFENGLEPPPDLIARVEQRQDRRTTDTEELRRLIQRVVQEMTEEELYQLPLPTRAVLKATTTRRR